MIASTAVAAIGQGVSAISANQQYRYEAKVARANARAENERARDALDRGRTESLRYQRQLSQQIGDQNAALAANGVDISFGSAANVRGDTLMFGREDVDTINRNAFREARGFEISSANYRADEAGKRRQASGALVQGAFGMGSTILGGATQYSNFRLSRRRY